MKNGLLLFFSILLIPFARAQKPWYYPLKKGNDWTYQCSFETQNGQPATATLRYRITDTIHINKLKYFVLSDEKDSVLRYLRFDAGQGYYYYRSALRNHNYSPEQLFLKNDLHANEQWGTPVARFKVSAVYSDTTINHTNYKDVYAIEETLFSPVLKKMLHLKHWYAKGIGEIAFYLPYPLSGSSGDRFYELSDYPMGR